MAIIDFSIPFELVTTEGTIWFNAGLETGVVDPEDPDGWPRWILTEEGCTSGPGSLRDSTEDSPVSNGSLLDEQLVSGYEVRLAGTLWENAETPACGEMLEDAWTVTSAALRALLSAADDTRLIWTLPSGRRVMVEDIQIADLPQPSKVDGVLHGMTFAVRSPYPYAMDLTEVSTPLIDGDPAVIVNDGTSPYRPVFRIDGAATAFTITHAESGLEYVYEGAGLPGGASVPGGSYVEIDMFRLGTAFINGDGASRMASINWETSNVIELGVGTNTVEVVGAGGVMLWQPAWA